MFAPVSFEATGPRAASAALIIRVVVVFPFVPVTNTTDRCEHNRRNACGSNASVTLPPIIAPDPTRSTRDTTAARLPTPTAISVHNGTLRRISPRLHRRVGAESPCCGDSLPPLPARTRRGYDTARLPSRTAPGGCRLRTAVAGRCWSWPRHTGSPPFVHHYQQVVWIRVGYAEIRAFTEVSRAQVHGERGRPRSQRLSWSQHRFLFILGVPAFGLALAYTMVTTYVPVLITQLSGPAITGVLLGAE